MSELDVKRELIGTTINKLLQESDWTQLPDAILSPTEKTAFIAYREALQSIDIAAVNPDTFAFPILPMVSSKSTTPAIITAKAKLKAVRITAKAIPSWATWTQAEWQTYFDASLSDAEVDKVTTIALARVALKRQNLVILNLTKMVLAMRDELWPDL